MSTDPRRTTPARASRRRRSRPDHTDLVRLFSERSQDVIFRYRTRPEPRFEYVSPSILALSGYSAAEIYADPHAALDMIHPDDRRDVDIRLADGRAFREPMLLRWVRKDGSAIWIEQTNTEIRDDDGRRIAVEGVARDASRQVGANAAVAESESRFRTALEELKLHASIVDRDGRIVFANRYLSDRTGWTREELIGRDVFDVFDAEATRPSKRASYRAAILSEVSVPTWETEWLTRDREVLRIAWSSSFVRDAAGRIQGIASVGEDVTERRRLEAGQARLSAAVEQTAEAIILTDAQGRIEYANPAFARATGIDLADAIGRRPWTIIPLAPSAGRFRAIARHVRSGRPWSGEYDLARPDGTIGREEASIAAVHDADGTLQGYVAVSRDVTRIREIQDTLDSTIHQRASVARALSHLAEGASLEATARGITDALLEVPGVHLGVILLLEEDGPVSVLAASAPSWTSPAAGSLLGTAQAIEIRRRVAGGPWSQTAAWASDDAAIGPFMPLPPGLLAMAGAPCVTRDGTCGVVLLGTTDPTVAKRMDAQIPTAIEFAATARGLLAGPLAERRDRRREHAEIAAVLDASAFSIRFQPIVDMATGAAIGYEALTRFDDGTAPDVRFADAERCDLGIDLEAATLERAIADSMLLPAGPWVSLNVSARMVLAGMRLADLLQRRTRPIVLEITEHDAIGDYGAVRAAVATLGPDIRVAVDDAGAGVANFTHIVELRPDFVKIDATLVRGVNTDLTRQALIVGLHHFARTTNGWLIAEGVETEEERVTLRSLDIDFGQGFHFGRPAAAESWDRPQPLPIDGVADTNALDQGTARRLRVVGRGRT